ncbi:MAG: ATP-binding protein [Rhodobacteraceae bacterium]|nr:MAG: ATP-binding protein [Paracoccaceae bacterium]
MDQAVTTRMADRRILIEAETGTFAVRAVLDRALAVLAEWRLPIACIGNVHIVLAEALNNVAEHAYGFRDGGRFSLDMTLEDGRLTCVVRDHGTPFPEGTPPDGDAVALDGPTESLPEGGFGWFMIRKLTEDLAYDHADGCNALTLRFAVV